MPSLDAQVRFHRIIPRLVSAPRCRQGFFAPDLPTDLWPCCHGRGSNEKHMTVTRAFPQVLGARWVWSEAAMVRLKQARLNDVAPKSGSGLPAAECWPFAVASRVYTAGTLAFSALMMRGTLLSQLASSAAMAAGRSFASNASAMASCSAAARSIKSAFPTYRRS